MKTVIAIDSFKGSLSSLEAGYAAQRGVRRVYPDADIKVLPLADGGEGTVEAIVYATDGEIIKAEVTSALGDRIIAEYGVINGKTAVIEMAAAAGITLVPLKERNPLYTTTYGVGELILDAIDRGCRDFLIGIGGSATNDGGIGMLLALGFDLLDRSGKRVSMFGKGLADIQSIKTDGAKKELSECRFRIACDVKNPLCGENGCSAVYGPQKGATPEIIRDMDAWLLQFSRLTERTLGVSYADCFGAGAAGGLGFALTSYLSAQMVSGIELVTEAIGLESIVTNADIVITGEGRLDGQSAMGKAPVGVARLAKRHGIPVIAFSGAVAPDAAKNNDEGIDAFFPIVRAPITLSEAMDKSNAQSNMADTVEQVLRLYKAINANNYIQKTRRAKNDL